MKHYDSFHEMIFPTAQAACKEVSFKLDSFLAI